MAAPTYTLPTVGNPNSTEDPLVRTALSDLKTLLTDGVDDANVSTGGISSGSLASNAVTTAKITDANVTTAKITDSNVTTAKIAAGNVTNTKLDQTSVAQPLGLNDGTTVHRGKTNIATVETTTSASPVTLTTPDQVSNVVLATDGLIRVHFFGTWKSTVSGGGGADIFLGSNQVKRYYANTAAPSSTGAFTTVATTNTYTALWTSGGGMLSGGLSTAYTGDVTTGQIQGGWDGGSDNRFLGGPTCIFAAAGTYTVSIKFWATSGTTTVKDRKLWVEAVGF